MQKKKSPNIKRPKNQNPAGKVPLVKRINEGYFLSRLFLFLIFLQTRWFPEHILNEFFERLYRATENSSLKT